MPVACYLKKDALAYISGSRIAILFQAAARAMHPNISKEEEQQYSAHLLQVWTCVLLNEAAKLPDYIKRRLHWMGDSFRMYLCDTRIIHQDQHREALRASSEEVMDLISALPPIYFASAPCPKGLATRMTWGCTMMIIIFTISNIYCIMEIAFRFVYK
jgi:hypothetical protein